VTAGDRSTQPLVLLVVGTDHHPFDRVVRWVDAWAERHSDEVRVVIQYGTSAPPVHAEGRDLFPVDELDAAMEVATAVVCHGGPGTIMGAREAGVVPIVVPRRSEFGEHVDDHQVRFASRVAEAGQVHLVRTESGLATALDRALAGAPGFRLDATGVDPAAEAVARLRILVDRMLTGNARR
jgi:UDP-N-acetylglucosamine transferase subunit ALG13